MSIENANWTPAKFELSAPNRQDRGNRHGLNAVAAWNADPNDRPITASREECP